MRKTRLTLVDKHKDVRWAGLQPNYHIWFNQLCESLVLIRESENAHRHSQQLQRVKTIASFLPRACSPASAQYQKSSGTRPLAVSPTQGALPSRKGRRRRFGSLERVAKKCSESEQLISAVKTDTRGAQLDFKHIFSTSKSKALSVIRDGADCGDVCETILHSG